MGPWPCCSRDEFSCRREENCRASRAVRAGGAARVRGARCTLIAPVSSWAAYGAGSSPAPRGRRGCSRCSTRCARDRDLPRPARATAAVLIKHRSLTGMVMLLVGHRYGALVDFAAQGIPGLIAARVLGSRRTRPSCCS